jgi:hypothetical protein
LKTKAPPLPFEESTATRSSESRSFSRRAEGPEAAGSTRRPSVDRLRRFEPYFAGEALDLDTVSISTVVQVIKNLLSKALPVVAAAALLYPASRKLADADWREELTSTYQLGDQSFGGWFFVMVGLLELAMAGLILWPKTRIPAGLAMAGFFVGALVFNLFLRVDQDMLPADRPTLSTLIPLDTSHLLIGLAVAWLWRSAGNPTDLLVDRRAN